MLLNEELSKKLYSDFRADAEGLVNALIANHSLRGNVRDTLSEHILDKPNRPWSKAFSWLPLMPRRLSMVLTDGCCNLACRMCGGSQGKLQYVTPEKFRIMLENIPTLDGVTFVSGNSEPLMHPAFGEILSPIQENNLSWQLVTNGHLLKKEIAEKMCTGKIPGQGQVSVSIDAASDAVYRKIRGKGIDRVLENLKALAEVRKKAEVPESLMIDLLIVGMEDNICDLPDLVKLAASIGAFRVKLTHLQGDYEPGDFTKNSDWKDYVLDAHSLSRSLDVYLDLPVDTVETLVGGVVQEEETDAAKPVDTVKPVDTAKPVESKPQPAAKKSKTVLEKISDAEICSWFRDIHIDIDGNIKPCCHMMSVDLGNIFEMPLNQNSVYLDARRTNLEGKFFNGCQNAQNCIFMQKWRSRQKTDKA